MNNFDLKKFLVENKLTTASKLVKEQDETVDAMTTPAEQALRKAGITPDQTVQLTSANNTFFYLEGTYPFAKAVSMLNKVIDEFRQEENFDPQMYPVWDFSVGQFDPSGAPLSLLIPEADDILIKPVANTSARDGINENDVATQEITPNEGSNSNMDKYLKMETAQAILSELDTEMALAELEIKKEQIQSIIQEIESKISTLEEDAGMKGFVDKAAINEKRRVVKELNRAYEKVNKLSEKMHAKRKKKMK
jgi:hypothetical protein